MSSYGLVAHFARDYQISTRNYELNKAWEFILLQYKLDMHKDRGTCREICKEFKVRKPRDGTSRYLSGQVRCNICGIFLSRHGCHDREENPATDNTVDLYCNCCNCMVRSKPRNKQELQHKI